jgi:hypothetical protein
VIAARHQHLYLESINTGYGLIIYLCNRRIEGSKEGKIEVYLTSCRHLFLVILRSGERTIEEQ